MSEHKKDRVYKYTAVTHAGSHHMDEAMAVAILMLRYSSEVWVVRTGDPAEAEAADFVLDVGGVYDPRAGKFDHHQGLIDPNLPRPSELRPRGYATAGLVWRRFGPHLVGRHCRQEGLLGIRLSALRRIVKDVDEGLMAPIDNWDNGVFHKYDGGIPAQYMISVMKFTHAVNACMRFLTSKIYRSICAEREFMEAQDTINSEDGIQVWFFGPHVVLQAKPGGQLPLQSARRITRDRYDKDVLGVVSAFVNQPGKSVFVLGASLTVPHKVREFLLKKYGGAVESHASGSMFFSDDQDALVDFARTVAGTPGALQKAVRS